MIDDEAEWLPRSWLRAGRIPIPPCVPPATTNRTPLVSILIPCHNYGRFLPSSVGSALTQTDVAIEVVIVDDASTDDSKSVAADLARSDSRIRLIALSENIGVIRAMNRAIREAQGEYLVKLDADDLLAPGSLRRSVALLEHYPNVGFAYGRPRHFTGDAPPAARLGHASWTIWPGADWLALRCRRAVNCISQPEAMIRANALRAVGDYNTALPHTYDLEMWLRLAAAANVGRINGVDQGFYRVHAGSMSRTVNAGLLTDLIGRRDAFLGVLSTGGAGLAQTVDLEETVRRQIAAQALEQACRAYDRDRIASTPVDELITFSTATFSAAETLPQWRGLQRRRSRAQPLSRWAPASIAAAALRRLREELAHARWLRTGV
ncbi:hypothetical+protein [Methylocapsa aurea]